MLSFYIKSPNTQTLKSPRKVNRLDFWFYFNIINQFIIFQFNIVSTYPRGGGGYSHTLPIRICAAQRGRHFEAPDLERGIHFRDVF